MSASWEPGYLVAVADGLVFSLAAADWNRLSACDGGIRRDRVREALSVLDQMGVRPSFGDGELPMVPPEGSAAIEVLRDQLGRISASAPRALADGADSFSRILCSDPWPRIYTTCVLDWPSSSPVHMIQASDLTARMDQWARLGQLTQFAEVQLLILFGSPLGRSPWPFDLGAFADLRALDVSASGVRALPPSIAKATRLEALELAGNPLDAASLAPLASLAQLRYLGLRDTGLTPVELSSLHARLAVTVDIDHDPPQK